MNIAIVDDKITSKSILNNNTKCYYVDDELRIEKLNQLGGSNEIMSEDSHADICSKIIRKYNSDCKITNIIVKGATTGDLYKLIAGLDFASEIDDINIVNLSIGFTEVQYAVELNRVIGKLFKKKIKIVASYSNSDVETYPASLNNVIGCKASKKSKELGFYKQNRIYYATGTHLIRSNFGKLFFTPNVNSFDK